MDAPDFAVQKHSIVPRHVKISVGSADFAARLDRLDDPCSLEPSNFNKIAFLHLITFKSLARYLRSGIGGLPTSLTI